MAVKRLPRETLKCRIIAARLGILGLQVSIHGRILGGRLGHADKVLAHYTSDEDHHSDLTFVILGCNIGVMNLAEGGLLGNSGPISI